MKLEVKFYNEVNDKDLKFAVIMARYDGKWIFCKHKERETYEIPGGHRELDETILDTAKREFQEETGAIEFEIDKIEFFNNIPINLTYPEIQPYLYNKAIEIKGIN